ncbi:MAG: hypothetical protein AAF533_24880 [Acidobacteriota bacterium]
MSETDVVAERVKAGWRDHDADPEGVLTSVSEVFESAGDAGAVASLTGLVLHVSSEHLAEPERGLSLLDRIGESAPGASEEAARATLARSRGALLLSLGRAEEAEACIDAACLPGQERSSVIARVNAIAAGALGARKRWPEAAACFRTALEAAGDSPSSDDPAARSLAVTGNNLACSLEETADRDAAMDELLLTASRAGRRYWEIAGGWTEVERADYRLAMTQLALGRPQEALEHARACLQVCRDNEAEAGELFFAHEALAKSQHACGDADAARASRESASEQVSAISDDGFRGYCEGELRKLDALLER